MLIGYTNSLVITPKNKRYSCFGFYKRQNWKNDCFGALGNADMECVYTGYLCVRVCVCLSLSVLWTPFRPQFHLQLNLGLFFILAAHLAEVTSGLMAPQWWGENTRRKTRVGGGRREGASGKWGCCCCYCFTQQSRLHVWATFVSLLWRSAAVAAAVVEIPW